VEEKQKQTILDIPKVIAVGISAPVATILTSRFGVASTLIGLALSAVILTALADMLKVYLARAPATVAKVPDAVAKMPSGLRARLSWRNVRGRLRAAFARFSSLSPAPTRRRSVMIGSVVAAGISFFVGLIIVTGLELGVGNSLSCWVWHDCPTESSTDDGGSSSRTSTLPSIFGGGSSASSGTPEVRSAEPQQQPALPGSPESPSMSPSVAPSPSAAPSEIPGTEAQDSVASDVGQDQSSLWEEDQQQNLPDYSGEDQQQSASNNTEEDRSSRSQDSAQKARSPEFPSVPWTT
jgi:hypothetical protein